MVTFLKGVGWGGEGRMITDCKVYLAILSCKKSHIPTVHSNIFSAGA